MKKDDYIFYGIVYKNGVRYWRAWDVRSGKKVFVSDAERRRAEGLDTRAEGL